jgi:copper(I)-binding protein
MPLAFQSHPSLHTRDVHSRATSSAVAARLRTMILFTCAILVSMVAVQTARAHDFRAGSIHVDHPWARPTPDGAKVGAGYISIRNSANSADRLVSATADIANKTEIHEVAVDAQGVMRMRPMPKGIAIPAGETVQLKPSSYHLMFLELKRPLKPGEKFPGVLTFEKGGTIKVEFVVEAKSSGGGAHGAKH